MLNRASLLCLVFAAVPACGWFAGSGESTVFVPPAAEGGTEAAAEAAEDAGPDCRPASADARGDIPWSAGDTTPGGWTVSAVDDEHLEFIRLSLSKDGTDVVLEVAFNESGPGDWSTDRYRLMPAPEVEAPQDLLDQTMEQLRAFAAAESGPPFVRRVEGVVDVYAGLPPCEE